jgi:hypothetical protein
MESQGELTPFEQPSQKMTIVARRGQDLLTSYEFIDFKGRCMVLDPDPYPHYIPLRKDRFERMAYTVHDGLTRSQVSDTYAYVAAKAENRDEYGHYIKFGLSVADAMLRPELNDGDIMFTEQNRPVIWDTRNLTWLYGEDPDLAVWRSPYPRLKPNKDDPTLTDTPIEFIMSLAGGDAGVYDDIMQSIAPIIMEKKPDGVVWWVGSGANGKSTLMDALYRLFPGQLASISVKALEDGRDTPALNTALANVVRESPEGRIDDTERYKALGTHENFAVHKFHSQDGLLIDGNIHSIFNANNIPAFADKGHSAKRRTFIIPFNQVFAADPEFERKTFTAKFFAELVTEMTKYAQRLKDQGYRYKFSAVTAGAKEEYDQEANNAEQYIKETVHQGLVAFNSYNPVRIDYENWCADNGYTPLGITNLRKALRGAGFEKVSAREGDNVGKIYRLSTVGPDAPLELMGLRTPGMFTTYGFEKKPDTPDPEPVPKQTSILNNKW